MEFIFENLFKVSFSTFNLFFSFVVFLFLVLWYFKVVWYGIVGWNFLGMIVLQFSVFILSILIWLNVFNFVSLNTNVYMFFNLFFNWSIAVYFVFVDREISLFRKIFVLSVLLFIILILFSNNELVFSVLSALILVFVFFNIITVFLSSVKSDILIDFIFFCFVFLATIVYSFGYDSWVVEFVLVLGISLFMVVRILFVFVLSYITLMNYRRDIKDDVNSISSITREVYNVWENLSIYRNSTQKLVFMLNEDTKRVYSYFRYIGSIISNFYDKVQDIKFSFERYIDEIKSLSDKTTLFLSSLDGINNNYVELGKMLDDINAKVSKDISFFKNISDEFNSSLNNLKTMKEYIQERIKNMESLLVELSRVIKGISFIEQVSVEGSISSSNYGFNILSESFTKLKNYSSYEIEEILKIRASISHFNGIYYTSIEKISEIQSDVYKVLSFSDSIINLFKNVSSILSGVKVEVIDVNKLVELKDMLNEDIRNYESVKEELSKSFEVIEEMLSTVENMSEKISSLATGIVYVVDVMEFLSKNFDNINSSLKILKKEIDSILE